MLLQVKVLKKDLAANSESKSWKCNFLLVVVGLGFFIGFGRACEISEYYCDNRKCISLDKFCNGVNDCGDSSDEPRHCSPCNRTYYGEVGGTYTIAVHRPSSRDSQMPYTCQLTFAAGGSKFGDLVQLIFNSVTLGPSPDQDRSYSSSGGQAPTCREGFITLNEPDRPATAGHWCGHDWGQAVFFSETSRVTLTLSLNSVPTSGTFAFDFRLTYKFLRKVDSAVRYGPPSNPFSRGELLQGTFCSLIYNNCEKQRCRLQSPGFPGLYPRNITCYYAIKQLNAPVGHRSVIQLSQEKDFNVFVRNRAVAKKHFISGESIGDSGLGYSSASNPSSGTLTFGDECDPQSDHVTIYDGYTIRDPVLLRFCGGGKFPTIISSGNEVLVEFYSAPTDFLLYKAIHTPIQGFHLAVDVKYLPLGSHTYVENHNCLFTVSSFQQKRGFLTSPQHSLPSHTTCTYLLEGSPGEIVWISLLKFFIGKEYGKTGNEGQGPYMSGLTGSGMTTGDGGRPANYVAMGQIGQTSLECNTTFLQIWQGTYSEKFNNATLLAHLCEDTPIRRTCEFMLTSTSQTSSKPPPRACHPDESFISKGPNMSVKLKVETTTVLRPAEFKIYYEFVDTRQDGEPLSHPQLIGRQKSFPNLPKSLKEGNPEGDKDSNAFSPKFRVEDCSRIFRTQNRAIQAGSFSSPRNIFFFGRGGVTNLTCIYRFQGGKHERVKVTFNKISLPGGFCKSEVDQLSGRSMCRDLNRNDTSPNTKHRVTEGRVQLWEVPWNGNDSRVMKECLCETPESGSVSFISISSTMDIVLEVKNMQPFHDQDHFTFEGRYEFIKHPDCSRTQKLKGASGAFTLRQPEKVPHQSCTHYPWEIVPQSSSHYIYLTLPGRTMKKFSSSKEAHPQSSSSSSSSSSQPQTHCDTRNRILVYSGGFFGKLLQIICPEDTGSSSTPSNRVEIFSTGWDYPQEYPNFVDNPHLSMTNLPSSNQLIVELVSRGPGSSAMYEVKYIQVSRKDEPLDWRYNAPQTPLVSVSGGSVITDAKSMGGGQGIGGAAPGAGGSSSGGGGVGTSSGSSIASSSIQDQIEEDVCFKYKCPELNACISPSLFCDGVSHCPSGFDEAECEYFPIPRTYLVLVAASLITFVVLSCCFGCLICKKRKEERREKLLMNSRTPTEEMFFGGTGTGSIGIGTGMSSYGQSHSHSHQHHREITC